VNVWEIIVIEQFLIWFRRRSRLLALLVSRCRQAGIARLRFRESVAGVIYSGGKASI
jgi:hypothetical protein